MSDAGPAEPMVVHVPKGQKPWQHRVGAHCTDRLLGRVLKSNHRGARRPTQRELAKRLGLEIEEP